MDGQTSHEALVSSITNVLSTVVIQMTEVMSTNHKPTWLPGAVHRRLCSSACDVQREEGEGAVFRKSGRIKKNIFSGLWKQTLTEALASAYFLFICWRTLEPGPLAA